MDSETQTPSKPWRTVRAETESAPRQRVVPLPLAFAALILPFLAAWAAADPAEPQKNRTTEANPARALAEPYAFLDRDRRVPEAGDGYVDVWGAPRGWEIDALRRRDHGTK